MTFFHSDARLEVHGVASAPVAQAVVLPELAEIFQKGIADGIDADASHVQCPTELMKGATRWSGGDSRAARDVVLVQARLLDAGPLGRGNY